MPYQKDILVMAPLTSVEYRDIFPYIKNDSLRADIKGQRYFDTPSGNGKCFGNIVYLTTLKPERHTLELKETYSPEKYPKFDNYDAINVYRSKDIPIDYEGPMGVPLSFLKWYDPREWEMLDELMKPHKNGKALFTRFIIRRRNSTLS